MTAWLRSKRKASAEGRENQNDNFTTMDEIDRTSTDSAGSFQVLITRDAPSTTRAVLRPPPDSVPSPKGFPVVPSRRDPRVNEKRKTCFTTEMSGVCRVDGFSSAADHD